MDAFDSTYSSLKFEDQPHQINNQHVKSTDSNTIIKSLYPFNSTPNNEIYKKRGRKEN